MTDPARTPALDALTAMFAEEAGRPLNAEAQDRTKAFRWHNRLEDRGFAIGPAYLGEDAIRRLAMALPDDAKRRIASALQQSAGAEIVAFRPARRSSPPQPPSAA